MITSADALASARPFFGIQNVVQAITEEIAAEDRKEDAYAWNEGLPWFFSRYEYPSCSIPPQVAVGGGTPAPRRLRLASPPWGAECTTAAQVRGELATQSAAALDKQMPDRSPRARSAWMDHRVNRGGGGGRFAQGLQDMAQRRSWRRPCRRPIHQTVGPDRYVSSGFVTAPARRSWTYRRSASLTASFAGFRRRARRSACHWAVKAR